MPLKTLPEGLSTHSVMRRKASVMFAFLPAKQEMKLVRQAHIISQNRINQWLSGPRAAGFPSDPLFIMMNSPPFLT